MRDVENGYVLRYVHANVASFFFIFVYSHIGRNLYYGSFKSPRVLVWSIGVIILILMIAIAFLGYVHSPKWFNLNKKCSVYLYQEKNSRPSLILKGMEAAQNLKYNKLNNKLICHLNSVRKYSTFGLHTIKSRKKDCSVQFKTNVEIAPTPLPIAGRRGKGTERLNILIKELGINPVYIFEDLNTEITKKQILNDTKGLSGIYMIINKITKDYYIGSASTNRFYARFSNHVIYFTGSKIVKSAVKKYDLKNFAFIILELYPNVVTKENNKELLDLEDKYLKLLLPNYNILTEAGSSFGYKHTEVDRQKMKDIYSDKRREMIGELNRGKKLSYETINKMKEKALNRAPMSNNTKLKCITNTRPVVLYNLNGTVYGKYSTITKAAEAINCNVKTINRALNTEKKLVKRQWIVKDLSTIK
jgi:group I intron endonuclease